MFGACCRSYAKGFGAVGALYAGSECVIEKVRIEAEPDAQRLCTCKFA